MDQPMAGVTTHDPHFRPMNESMTEVAIPFLPNERMHLHIQQNPVAEFIDPLRALKAAKSGVKGGCDSYSPLTLL